jgi:hypothetical protein
METKGEPLAASGFNVNVQGPIFDLQHLTFDV